MNELKQSWDIVIIGSGAGGGAAAYQLCQAGLKVLLIEKGKAYSAQQYRHDELSMLHSSFFTPDPAFDPHTVVTKKTTTPVRHKLGWSASCVGGGTEHMGAYLYRYHPNDFRMREHFGEYAELCDWPYRYDELEPYYNQAEELVGISGDSQADQAYVPRSQAYPMPALPTHPCSQALDKACRDMGYQASATPRSVNSIDYQGRPACQLCQHCGAYGCPTGARGTSLSAMIKPALASGQLKLLSECMVTQLTTDKSSLNASPRIKSCTFLDRDGNQHEVKAKTFILACSAVESARLLLLSKNESFPTGLANRSGLVGKHLQLHAVTMGWAEFDQLPGYYKPVRSYSPFIGRSLYDFYELPPGISPLRHGGILRFSRTCQEPISDAISMALNGSPIWGASLVQKLQNHYQQTQRFGYEVFHAFIPNTDTYVTLDEQTKDRWGLPVAQIHLDVDPHQLSCGEWIARRAESILQQLKPKRIGRTVTGGTTWHLAHGTCRAHEDPQSGVLNKHCQSHDLANLFVVDASFMPSNGAAPPTLTIIANALKTSHYIINNLYK